MVEDNLRIADGLDVGAQCFRHVHEIQTRGATITDHTIHPHQGPVARMLKGLAYMWTAYASVRQANRRSTAVATWTRGARAIGIWASGSWPIDKTLLTEAKTWELQWLRRLHDVETEPRPFVLHSTTLIRTRLANEEQRHCHEADGVGKLGCRCLL